MSEPVRGLYCAVHQQQPVQPEGRVGWRHADGSPCASASPVYIPTCQACGDASLRQFTYARTAEAESLTCRSCGDVRVLARPTWSP